MAAAESRSSAGLAPGWVRAERNSACLAVFPLRNQEQIQGSKNAPIARFDGLGCYQTRSEINAVSRARTAAKNGSRPRAEQALKTRLCGRCAASRARQSPVHCANQSGWRRPKADQATRWLWAGFGPGWVLAALVLNGIQPALPLLSRSEIRSKFKALKTPLSHGLTGLAAIKQGAK